MLKSIPELQENGEKGTMGNYSSLGSSYRVSVIIYIFLSN